MNKYEQVTKYLADNYIPLGNWIYFNATVFEDGNTSINTIESERATKVYIDGSKEVELLFAIAMIKTYDTEMSNTNIEAISEIDNFMTWIEEQNNIENYPFLGDNITVLEINVLDLSPSLAVDTEQNLSKYQFNCNIKFLESKVTIQ